METAGSVSKGCFVFKGKKKKANVDDYLPDGGGKSAHFCRDRFVQMWDDIDVQIQVLQSELNSNIFDDLLKFTQTCYQGFIIDDRNKRKDEIPAAALITGVNMPDHGTMFNNLVTMLNDRVTSHVAKLKSKDCPNVKSILSCTLSQLLGHLYEGHERDDEEEVEINCKKLPLTLSVLAAEYKKRYTNTQSSSPKKRKLTEDKMVDKKECPPVVIVMEDFENFEPRVIQDFILIASKYINVLPVVLVFGIATSVSTIHRLLPNHVSSLLCMEKFQAPASSEYLSLVINQVLMTAKYPFKLGQSVFQLLLDIFLFHDFSVLNFNNALRFCMLDHYTNQKSSFLCCPVEEVNDVVMTMDENGVEEIRQLPSFMRYVESCDVKEQPDLLLKEKFTKKHIIELIQHIHKYHSDFFPILACLHLLVCKLPGYPLGKQVREVYSRTLQRNIFDSEDYLQAINLLKLYSKDELKTALTQCKDSLDSSHLTDVTQKLEEFLQQIDNLDNIVEEEEDDTETTDTSLPSRASLHQLRQKLQDMSKKQKKQTPYEKYRISVVNYLDELFRQYLKCPMSLPLHEIFYYNSSKVIKHQLNAAPRSSLQMALSNPHCYLQCECCNSENGQIQSTMPDTCIVYKLHLECGQLINLYDWMQAFITVVSPEDTENSEEKTTKLQTELQARFIQAVSQLQFLGFVKPTKRKTDHVARLTWGGC